MTYCNFVKYLSPSSRRQNSRSGCSQKSANHIFSSRKGLNGGVTLTAPSPAARINSETRGQIRQIEQLEETINIPPRVGCVVFRVGRDVPIRAQVRAIHSISGRYVADSAETTTSPPFGSDGSESVDHSLGAADHIRAQRGVGLIQPPVSPIPPGTESISAMV